ncbi:MAG: protease family protein [Acidimicrobiaceae bacterium]|nr:protease family protein [Acidimicrobiaceae bacterium]
MRAPTASSNVPRPDRLDRQIAKGVPGRRRQVVVVVTLVAGSAILAGTLAAPSGSGPFFALGLLVAVTWIVGAVLAGPRQPTPRGARSGPTTGPTVGQTGPIGILAPVLVGAVLYGAFFVARLIAGQIPFLSRNVTSVLARADAGPRAAVLLVALVNGVGEELFFRGALVAAFGKHRPAVWATVVYCLVTVCTLNIALVVAAVVMGTVFMVERRVTGGVAAPILTHLSWSTLVIFFLPR